MSKFFLLCTVIWILGSLAISVAGVGFVMNTPGIGYEVPNSSTSSILKYNATSLTYNAQNFNMYGEGISGTEVYYNLSASTGNTGSTYQHVSGGYAGETNGSGFIQLSLPLVPGMVYYDLEVHFHNKVHPFSQNSSNYLTTEPNQDTLYAGNVAMSPVKSLTDPGTFALHIWALPGHVFDNASIFYQSSPQISSLYSYPAPFNKSKQVSITTTTLAGQENVQTGIPITGHTYYYLAGMESSSGTLQVSAYFQSVPTPAMQSVQAVGSVFGIATLLAIFSAMVVVVLLSSGPSARTGWIERILPEGFPETEERDKASTFIRRVSATTVASLPIVAVTALFAYYSSSSQFGASAGIITILACSAGMVFSIAISSAYVSILLGKGFIKNLPRESPDFEKYSRKSMLAFLPLAMVEVFIFDINFSGFISSKAYPALVAVVNYLNPFDFVNPLQQIQSNSVTFGNPYTFNPSEYMVTYPLVLMAGFIWFLVMIILPYIWFKKEKALQVVP